MRTDERRRTRTETWCKDGKIGYVVLSGGARVRTCVGVGPPLVLMHTVRTQLDHFQFVIPRITDAFTVYALDFPGMGWSTSNRAPLRRGRPAAGVVRWSRISTSGVTLAGEPWARRSALTASVDLGDQQRRIVAFNTYDFADGMKRRQSARAPGDQASACRDGARPSPPETKPLLWGILRGGLYQTPSPARPLPR